MNNSQSLKDLLQSLERRLPSKVAVLGSCEDKIPLLFDLTNPSPSNLLICSDSDESNLQLLKTMLHSIVSFSDSDEVQFIVLANDPSRWEEFESKNHCLGIVGAYEDSGAQQVLNMAETVEQRRMGRQHGATILFIVDDLRWLMRMDFDNKLNFEWLLGASSQVDVWMISAISSNNLSEVQKMMNKFKTRIIGRMSDNRLGHRVADSSKFRSDQLDSNEFVVKAGGEWTHFFTPVF